MPADVPPPRTLGRYELLARLATGGMGEIYLARTRGEAGFEKLVVVKRLLPELVGSGRFVAMLLDEARIAARLSHPNVCEVFDLGQADGERFIVMQYLEGVPLTRLVDHAPRDLAFFRLAAAVAQQACEGLHHAHELADADGSPLGLVHRDVSPSNLFVTDAGVVKILDFGIAKAPGQTETTEVGVVKGKTSFMSPEQVRGEPLDRRSDLFALGAVLFELASGKRAFERGSDVLVAQAILVDPIPDVREVEPAVPVALSRVIARALSRDRLLRFATAREMGDAVLEAAASFGGAAAPAAVGAFVREHYAAVLDERRAVVRTTAAPCAAGAPGAPQASEAADLGTTVAEPRRRPATGTRRNALALGGLALVALVAVLVVALGPGATSGRDRDRPAPPTRPSLTVPMRPEPADAGSAAPVPAEPVTAQAPPLSSSPPRPRTIAPSPAVEFGWISVDSTPYATVWVDGRRLGITPLIHQRVSAGSHRVRAALPDGREQRFPIEIRPGAEAPALHLSW